MREEDDRRRAYKQAITDNQRHRDETLAQYSVRRIRDFRTAASFGVVLPETLRAMLLREGAGLSDQGQQNLVALVQGREDDPDAIARALSRMDVRSDRLTAFEASQSSEEGPSYVINTDDASEEDEALDDDEIIRELEPLDLTEDQVTEVFAVLEQKRRSWKQNKLFKAEAKKDRGSFVKDGNRGLPRGHHGGAPGDVKPGARGQMNREQLKKISKCRLCHKRGHWAEDCHLRKKAAAPSGFAYCGNADFQGAGLTFMSLSEPVHADDRPVGSADSLPVGPQQAVSLLSRSDVIEAAHSVLRQSEAKGWAFLTLSGNEAILDIGATQDLIGTPAMKALEKTLAEAGLRAVPVQKHVVTPSGIGGTAKVAGVMLVPISPGGVPGVIELTVLESDIPPLLSVGFLEFLQASIDLQTDVIVFKKLDLTLPMRKLSSGHRTIPLVKWSGEKFPVPDEIQQKYGLSDGVFNINSTVSCAYTKDAAATHSEHVSQFENNHGVRIQNLFDEPIFNQFATSLGDEGVSRHDQHGSDSAVICEASAMSCSMKPHTSTMPCSSTTPYTSSINISCSLSTAFHSTDSRACHEIVKAHEARSGESGHGMSYTATTHDADSQRLQRQVRSSELMGLTQSNPTQFDSLLTRHGTRQLSCELRDQHARQGVKGSSEMGPNDERLDAGMGDRSDELCPLGEGRAGHQVLQDQCYETTRTCRPRSGPVPSSGERTDQPVQPVCLLDGVSSLSSPDLVSVQASQHIEQGQRQGKIHGIDIDSCSGVLASRRSSTGDPVQTGPSRSTRATPAAAPEATEILQEALRTMNMQNSQFGQLMAQIHGSLRDLAQGQNQMLTLMQPSPAVSVVNMEEDQWSDPGSELQNPNTGM